LTGKRAHFELAAGYDIAPLIATYGGYSYCRQIVPKQVWDEADRPECGQFLGRSAGSAMPPVWVHAEYLKLLRSALYGKVFDHVDPVIKRYSDPEGRNRVRHDLEVHIRYRPIQILDADKTLRILDSEDFDVAWTDNAGRQSKPRLAARWAAHATARTSRPPSR
jgi:glucoamylase